MKVFMMSSNNDYAKQWNESYIRGENNILYPQSEVIRFLNKFVAKRLSMDETNHLLKRSGTVRRCLDFGCGVGTHAQTCEDFGLVGYGIDISAEAISRAQNYAKENDKPELADRFQLLSPYPVLLPFENNFFDVCIAESCLDSMSFEDAKLWLKEIFRCTSGLVYCSLISAKTNQNDVGDTVVAKSHEFGTIQCFYDLETIVLEPLTDEVIDARYFVVLNS